MSDGSSYFQGDHGCVDGRCFGVSRGRLSVLLVLRVVRVDVRLIVDGE